MRADTGPLARDFKVSPATYRPCYSTHPLFVGMVAKALGLAGWPLGSLMT